MKQARDVLAKFNQGYINRDVNAIEAFADALFINSPDTAIMGTSNGEFCLGFEACKELIKTDWKGWGDVRFDVDSAVVQTGPSMTWFAVPGTLQLSFDHTDAKFADYLDFVKEELATAEISPLEGLTLINWALTQFSFAREGEERTYLWPITLTGALVPDEGELKFKYMQFSVPCSTYPDQRVGTVALDRLHHVKALRTRSIEQSALRTDALRAVEKIQVGAPAFNTEVTPLVIGPQNTWHQGMSDAQQGLAAIYEKWGQMELDLEYAIVQTAGDFTYIVSTGLMIKHVSHEESLRGRMQGVRDVIESERPSRDKLFLIQRDIAATLKEAASGSEHRWPCRLEAVYSHKGDEWLLNFMQISTPYYWIFEDKIEGKRL